MDEVDAELIAACLSGNADAWSNLIARYQRLIYSVAFTTCRESNDADDVFQQVCLELIQHLGEVRSIQALPAWLITVTRRRAFAIVRGRRSTEELDHEIGAADARIAGIEREHAVAIALDQTSERCRLLIRYLYLDPDEPSYAEIARRLDMPESSVGPTRARCMDKLRKLLESE